MTKTRSTALVAVLCALPLALPAPGLGAGAKFKGKTAQNRPVTFKLAGGKVKNFQAGVNVFCIGQGIEFNAAIPPKAMKVKKNGKFSYKGRDKTDGANIEIKGKIAGSTATGKVSMTYSTYDSSSRLFVGCSGEAKYTAKK